MRIAKLVIMIFVLLLIFQWPATAAWWKTDSLPVPANTKEEKKQTKKIAGSDFTFTYYTSALDIESIKNFYRSKLTPVGWKERQLQKELTSLSSDAQLDNSLSGFFGNNLMFEKDDEKLIVSFIPSGFTNDGKTRFTVSAGKMESNQRVFNENTQALELLAKPKKDIAPVYPGASLITLSEQPEALKATYFTKGEDVEKVLSFYKTDMAKYNWSLVKEVPLVEIKLNDLYKNYNSGNYNVTPNTASWQKANLSEMWFAELNFSNPQGDSCKIGVFKTIMAFANFSNTEYITIRVDYEKK